jgi:thiamine biosynthesis lipoprotein
LERGSCRRCSLCRGRDGASADELSHDHSDIARLNRQAAYRPVEVHPWTYEVLALALALYRDSAGLFDIAVAPVLRELGLLPGAPDRRAAPGDDQSAAPFRLLADNRVCFTRHGIAIDLSGIAKGFAVDRAIEALRAGGATQGIVNAGGDLAAFGPAPHPVYIRDPRHPGRVLAETDVFNGALATSGGRFDPMLSAAIGTCAVIDPAARAPARAILGATVRAPRCVFADALTKVVMIAGAASAPLLAIYGADALFVGADGDLQISAGWREAVQLAA